MPAPMTPAERQRRSRENRQASGHVLIQFSASPKARRALEAECIERSVGYTEALNGILERRRVK